MTRIRPLTPPVPGTARNVEFPGSSTRRLPNDLLIVFLPDSRLPQVNLRLGFRRGRAQDPSRNTALFSLTTEMLNLGAGGMSAQEIAKTLDHYAIQYESNVGLEASYLAWETLSPNLKASLVLLSRLVLQPDFPEPELVRLKSRWKSSLLQLRSQPSFLARERSRFGVYGRHPLSRVGITIPHLEATQASDLSHAHEETFTPETSLLLCCGDSSLEEVFALAEETFGNWKSSASPSPEVPAPPPFEPGRVDLVHRPGSVQARVLISGKAPKRSDPNLKFLKLANQVFGGSASSRLFLNLREEKGLTYGAYSQLRTFDEDGIFQAGADVRAEAVAVAVKETLQELEGLFSRPPQSEEINRSRSEIIGTFIRQMETASGVASLELSRRLHDLPEDYYTTFIPDLLAIEVDEMLEHSRPYFNRDRLQITVVGDAGQLRPAVSKFGKLSVWDVQGKLLEGAP